MSNENRNFLSITCEKKNCCENLNSTIRVGKMRGNCGNIACKIFPFFKDAEFGPKSVRARVRSSLAYTPLAVIF